MSLDHFRCGFGLEGHDHRQARDGGAKLMLPWPGGIEATENGAFIIALVAAVLYLYHGAQGEGIKWAAIKTAPVALFAVIAFLTGSPWLLVAGFAFSAIGDWSLAFVGDKPFLAGLGAFFLAHIAYIALFVFEAGTLRFGEEPWRVAICVALVIHALWMGAKLAKSVPEALKIPVFAYIAVISLMGVAASAYGSLTLLAGALLFAVSDTMLATAKFLIGGNDARQPTLNAGLWITYIAAQVLILISF
jgi:uncharacterized membrane protein YhhN